MGRGLVSLNLVVFLVVQLGIEPRRRAVFAERVVEGVLKGVVESNGASSLIPVASEGQEEVVLMDIKALVPPQAPTQLETLMESVDVKFISGLIVGTSISLITSLFLK
jgi:hypothetical protein